MLIGINPYNPPERLVMQAVDVLRRGGVIAYPTDTQYGIGCDIMNKRAIERIYQLRQRDKKKPFSFICADLKHISNWAKVSNYAYKTMRRLLPGPYTFILEGSRLVPKTMLTHLTHDVDHSRHAAGLPEGVEFAYDGQTLTIPLPGAEER